MPLPYSTIYDALSYVKALGRKRRIRALAASGRRRLCAPPTIIAADLRRRGTMFGASYMTGPLDGRDARATESGATAAPPASLHRHQSSARVNLAGQESRPSTESRTNFYDTTTTVRASAHNRPPSADDIISEARAGIYKIYGISPSSRRLHGRLVGAEASRWLSFSTYGPAITYHASGKQPLLFCHSS